MNTYESLSIITRLREEANRVIAGGVVSLNRKVDPFIIFNRGKGSKIYDVQGKEYIDYHAAFAPHLLGHNNDAINDAVIDTINSGWSLFVHRCPRISLSWKVHVVKLDRSANYMFVTATTASIV